MEKTIHVRQQFSGMPGLALGGYVCGLAGRVVGSAAEVTLRRPVKTGATLVLEFGDDSCVLREGDAVVAQGRPYAAPLDPPPRVSLSEATGAAEAYPGLRAHLFPSCFGCGPERNPGEGLRLFPGLVQGTDVVACPWLPDPSMEAVGAVAAEIVWAALDCPAIWALIWAVPPDSTERAVTGSIAAHLIRPVHAGQRYVVVGWPLGREDRKLYAGAAICAPDGEPHVIGKQTMMLSERGVPLGFNVWASSARQ